MRQMILGLLVGLLLAGIGTFWLSSRAEIEEHAPAPPEPLPPPATVEELLTVDPNDWLGPDPPEASKLTKEEIRFFRYDLNRDRIITRNEMLSSRTTRFRQLDVDGNNLLTFEEWAVTTVERFETADANANGQLTPSEFVTTAPKPSATRKKTCAC